MIQAATRYETPGDLGVIVCLFNLEKDSARAANFEVCRRLFDGSGIPLVTIEASLGTARCVLEPGEGVVLVRAAASLWQKERLINLALPHVPARCTKVAWIDADVLFENPRWAVEASARLNEAAVVQLAERIIRLPQDATEYSGTGDVWETFAAVNARDPNALLLGDFGVHGHTGFAWAARREVLETAGLYDVCVTGGADHVMAHAFCGDWDSPCLDRMLGPASAWRRHARDWASRVYPLVKARIGFVEGAALHLWHGPIASRQHMRRYRPLWAVEFDPERHLELDKDGCWQWRCVNPSLRRGVGSYMDARRHEADRLRSH